MRGAYDREGFGNRENSIGRHGPRLPGTCMNCRAVSSLVRDCLGSLQTHRSKGRKSVTLTVSSEFSKLPGPRFKRDGEHSGEEFRIKLLEPRFKEAARSETTLLVDLDGGYGYSTAFLEEAFGGLARDYSPDAVMRVLRFRSTDEPYLEHDIKRYILAAVIGTQRK